MLINRFRVMMVINVIQMIVTTLLHAIQISMQLINDMQIVERATASKHRGSNFYFGNEIPHARGTHSNVEHTVSRVRYRITPIIAHRIRITHVRRWTRWICLYTCGDEKSARLMAASHSY